MTEFVMSMLRDRKEPVPPEDIREVAKRIKEMHCYVCPDIVKEYKRFARALLGMRREKAGRTRAPPFPTHPHQRTQVR